jgi:peptide deformylase
MSEIITINTESNEFKEEIIEPLTVYSDNLPMLSVKIPEHTLPLPNKNMTALVKKLKMTMKLYAGLGLSANQCNIYERVFVIGSEDFQFACINPKIIQSSPEMEKESEGCLSYPGLFVKIERPLAINVEFTTETGENKQMKLEGLTARCFMHELEHMNGRSFIQHVKPVALSIAKDKQKKRIKKVTRAQKNGIRI